MAVTGCKPVPQRSDRAAPVRKRYT